MWHGLRSRLHSSVQSRHWLSSVDKVRCSSAKAMGTRSFSTRAIKVRFSIRHDSTSVAHCASIGFVRLALKHNVPLVPIFSFGEHRVLDNVHLPKLQAYFKRYLGFPVPFFPYGRFYLPIPRRAKLTICVGQPIYPPVIRTLCNNWALLMLMFMFVGEPNEAYRRACK